RALLPAQKLAFPVGGTVSAVRTTMRSRALGTFVSSEGVAFGSATSRSPLERTSDEGTLACTAQCTVDTATPPVVSARRSRAGAGVPPQAPSSAAATARHTATFADSVRFMTGRPIRHCPGSGRGDVFAKAP